jgi:hypothetical protein
MDTRTSSKLLSVKLWGGLYLITYGVTLEAAYFAFHYAIFFHWAHNMAIFCFALFLGLKAANWVKPAVKLAWPVVLILVTGAVALGLLYLPWVLPFYYGDLRFGWSEHFNMALQSAFKLVLITSGTCLLIAYIGDRSTSAKLAGTHSSTVGVPPKA